MPRGAAGAERQPLLPLVPRRAACAGPPAYELLRESPVASSSSSPTPWSAASPLAYCRLGSDSGGSTPTSTGGASAWSSECLEVASPHSEVDELGTWWGVPGWMQPCGGGSADDVGGAPAPPAYGLLRSTTAGSDPQSPVSDPEVGYASTLPRQGPLPHGALLVRDAPAVRAGRAGLRDGTHLFVVMVGDPDRIRLVHEESLRAADWTAGHSSMVSPREFDSRWARGSGGVGHLRHTVLFAGELDYREEVGVVRWNNCSGHYKPACEDHWRAPLGHGTFQPVSLG